MVSERPSRWSSSAWPPMAGTATGILRHVAERKAHFASDLLGDGARQLRSVQPVPAEAAVSIASTAVVLPVVEEHKQPPVAPGAGRPLTKQ